MGKGEFDGHSHSEVLTPQQVQLADALFTTKTRAKVRRREGQPGNWIFSVVERETSSVDFAQEGEFALKMHDANPDAPLSPIYFNLRKLPPELLEQVGRAMAGIKESDDERIPAFCVGIPKAATPIGRVYSEITGIPHVEVLEKVEDDTSRRIIGVSRPKQAGPVRLLDDLVTHGHTKMESITALRNLGYEITDLTVLIDREQGARDDLAAVGVDLRAVFTMTQLLDYYKDVGYIDTTKHQEVLDYLVSL